MMVVWAFDSWLDHPLFQTDIYTLYCHLFWSLPQCLVFHWLSALALSFVPILRFEYLYDDIEDTLAAPSIIITFLLLLGVNILGSGADSSFQTEYHLLFISQVLFYSSVG